jgi:hypothetical protein
MCALLSQPPTGNGDVRDTRRLIFITAVGSFIDMTDAGTHLYGRESLHTHQPRLRMKSANIFIAVLALLHASLGAQETRPSLPPPGSLVVAGPAPRPWALSLEERAARRTAAESHKVRKGAHSLSATGEFAIDGRVTPELFFPFELFTQLIPQASGEAPAAARVRASYNSEILSLGWTPDSFWQDIVDATTHYRELVRANPRPDETTSRQICLERAKALHSLQKRYARINEFLYRSVAPRTVSAYSQPSANSVIWIEGGCQ